jgi:3',5'-nucleoside bisphosphate phosphatase
MNLNKIIDLHIHSNFSEDADFSVNEIFKMAEDASISVISITDHDSIKSVNSALLTKDNYKVQYIPGVEITTVFPIDNSQQHIIGYFIDNNNRDLQSTLDKIAGQRREIASKRIKTLRNLNFTLDEDNINRMTGNNPPAAVSIIVELLNNKNNLNDSRLQMYLTGEKKNNKIGSFYKDYFSEGGFAYIPFESISSQDAIKIIKQAGGIPVLAHPVFLKNQYLDLIKDMGISGIEAVSTYHGTEEIIFYIKYAEKNKLLITAAPDGYLKCIKN